MWIVEECESVALAKSLVKNDWGELDDSIQFNHYRALCMVDWLLYYVRHIWNEYMVIIIIYTFSSLVCDLVQLISWWLLSTKMAFL